MNSIPTLDVLISDCLLRDGLQPLHDYLPLDAKKKILKFLADTGITSIEITSMVSPKLLPQFADAKDMIHYAAELGVLCPIVLVPNLKGAERAIEAEAKSLVLPLSASETHSIKNIRKTREEQIYELRQIRKLINQQPPTQQPRLMVGIATCFGCSYEGQIDESQVLKLITQCFEIGVDEIGLADTVGYATPNQIKHLFKQFYDEFGSEQPVRAHFHDTFGLGLANIYAALDMGVRNFDASLCGLGGCPFAPDASGNVTLEDLVYAMQKQGLKTGIDLEKLLTGQQLLRSFLPNEILRGAINQIGDYPTGFTPECIVQRSK